MLDFESLRTKHTTLNALVEGLTLDDLRRLTNEMIDRELGLVADCTDADVTFEPVDPAANDRFAARAEDVNLAWTLGHVIVHITASSEEAAFLAAELARGVPLHGRSCSEIPWQQATTIAMCRAHLEESRRMRLASLEMWPDHPHLELTTELWAGMDPTDAVGRFVLGLMHDDSHLGQISEIVRQANIARVR